MEIEALISTVGFPIAAFIAMFWQNTQVIQKNTDALTKLSVAVEGLNVRQAIKGEVSVSAVERLALQQQDILEKLQD